MGNKRSFLLTTMMAVFACFTFICAEQTRREITFEAVIRPKTYDGTKNAEVWDVMFLDADGKEIGLRERPLLYNEETGLGDYKIVSALFNSANVKEANEVVITLELLDTPRGSQEFVFKDGKDSFTIIDEKIKQARGHITISCKDVFAGNRPNPVIDTTNIAPRELWADSTWLKENIIWRFALMNMEENNPNDPEAKPAWVREFPTTRGTWWVQAILKGSDNFTADTSRVDAFLITDAPTPINSSSVKTPNFGFAGIINGEINLSLTANSYTIEVYNLQGRLIARRELTARDGINATGLRITDLSRGMLILNVKQAGSSVLQHKMIVK